MAARGMILKLLHEGQKTYVVLDEDKGQTCVVRYPFGGQLFKVEVSRTKLKATQTGQREPYFDILRQLVGIKYEDPKKPEKTAPIKVAPAIKPKVQPMTLDQISGQGPMAIQCPECKTEFFEGHETHKPDCSLNHNDDKPSENAAS